MDSTPFFSSCMSFCLVKSVNKRVKGKEGGRGGGGEGKVQLRRERMFWVVWGHGEAERIRRERKE